MLIKNDCICTRENIKLGCNGFQNVEKIDPSILKVEGGECLLGGYLQGYKSLNFTYAWDTAFPFKVVFSNVECS